LIIDIHSKQSEADNTRAVVNQVCSRLDAIEAKVGNAEEIADRSRLAIRQLPFPAEGYSDFDMVVYLLREIRAPGLDARNDVIKVIRKVSAKFIFIYKIHIQETNCFPAATFVQKCTKCTWAT